MTFCPSSASASASIGPSSVDGSSTTRDCFHVKRVVTKLTVLFIRSEEHTSELQSQFHLVCRLLLEKKNRWNTSIRALDFNRRFGALAPALAYRNFVFFRLNFIAAAYAANSPLGSRPDKVSHRVRPFLP